MTTDSVTLTINRMLDAPRERVWDAFTHPSLFSQWWGPEGTTNVDVGIDANVGGRFAYRMHLPPNEARGGVDVGVNGEFTDVEPHRMLGYTYQWEGQALVTQVFVELEDRPEGGTEITVRHEGLPNTEFADYEAGWTASLDRLERVVDMSSPPASPTPDESGGSDSTASY